MNPDSIQDTLREWGQWHDPKSELLRNFDLTKFSRKLRYGSGRMTDADALKVEEAVTALRGMYPIAARALLLFYIGLSIKDVSTVTGYTLRTIRQSLDTAEGFVAGYLYNELT